MMYWIFLIAQFCAEQAHAASGAHDAHGPVSIPWHSLFVQAFNFGFLLLLLGYFLRKTVKAHFANRAAEYTQLVQKAEAAKAEAERTRATIQERLSKLESTADEAASKAKSDAAELKMRMMAEGKALSNKIEVEAQRSIAVELEKAKTELREELLGKALEAAGEKLQKNLSSTEQKKLQNEFVEKIQVVGG